MGPSSLSAGISGFPAASGHQNVKDGSTSTAGIDEREKWHHYRDIPTLRHYLLIDSESRQVRLYIRAGADWLEQNLGEGEWLGVTCGPVRLELSLDAIYDRSGLAANPSPD